MHLQQKFDGLLVLLLVAPHWARLISKRCSRKAISSRDGAISNRACPRCFVVFGDLDLLGP